MAADTGGRVEILREREYVARVVLDRVAARNAINPEMAAALEAAADALEGDASVRVIVLSGAGDKAFSAGADLATLAAGRDGELLRPRGGYLGLTAYPRRKPWIAAVRGVAAGGGLELALSCDLIVAGDSARLGLPEVSRGTIAGACGVWRLPRQVPQAIALEWLLTGELVPAPRAAAAGLVNQVVADAEVIEAALALAQRIAANAPLAVRETLAIARAAQRLPDADARALTEAACERLRAWPDTREGAQAFLEKRAPRWAD
ncbi:MAG: enoyl-CoA hydratase/isomerase family protein [Solimonas sp.]